MRDEERRDEKRLGGNEGIEEDEGSESENESEMLLQKNKETRHQGIKGHQKASRGLKNEAMVKAEEVPRRRCGVANPILLTFLPTISGAKVLSPTFQHEILPGLLCVDSRIDNMSTCKIIVPFVMGVLLEKTW